MIYWALLLCGIGVYLKLRGSDNSYSAPRQRIAWYAQSGHGRVGIAGYNPDINTNTGRWIGTHTAPMGSPKEHAMLFWGEQRQLCALFCQAKSAKHHLPNATQGRKGFQKSLPWLCDLEGFTMWVFIIRCKITTSNWHHKSVLRKKCSNSAFFQNRALLCLLRYVLFERNGR